MEVKPIPPGYRTITPYLTVKGAKTLINFLERAFNAKNMRQTVRPDGSIGNAEVLIGDSMIMIADGTETWQSSPTSIYMYVENCDAVYQKAIEEGGESIIEPQDMFYGDRNAGVKDFCGNSWWIGTHIEDVSDEEIQNRMEEQAAYA
jgi:PhnB protein